MQAALTDSGYLAELEAEGSVESAGRIENLGELVGSAREFTRLDEFLEQVALVADTDDLDDDNRVVLMTLHSAKGLEFPAVFLVGMEEGVFPHSRALTEPVELEEERRLAYVGITRAQQRLFLAHAWSRQLFGSTNYNPPSRFIDEIPAELIEQTGAVSGRTTYGRQSYRARDEWSNPPPYRRVDRDDTGEADRHRDRVVEAALAAGQRTKQPTPSNAQQIGLRRRRRCRASRVRRRCHHRHPRCRRQGRGHHPFPRCRHQAPLIGVGAVEEAVTMVVMVQHSAETLRKRQLFSRLWAVFVILWSVIRTVIIWAALGGYGFNPWIYLSIDLVCATIDAFTTPKMVLYFIDDHYRLAIKWGIVSLVAFVIPDIYIFAGTRTLPTRIIVVLCAIIGSMLALAVVSIVRKIRKGRADARRDSRSDGRPAPVVLELGS